MKIVATTPKGFLIEADADELSNLMGYSGDYWRREDRRSAQRPFAAGDRIPVKRMYDRLYRMANMGKELTEIAAKLKAASDFVDTSLPTIQRVNTDKEEEKDSA